MGFLDRLEMGLGTWAWGKGQVWGYGKSYTDKDLKETFQTAIRSGIRLYDTAEVYGEGESESFLGQFLKEKGSEKIYIATKFAPLPWRISTSELLKALRGSLNRLGLKSVDLYQIHWASPPRSIKAWMEPLAQAVKDGLAAEFRVFKSISELKQAGLTIAVVKYGFLVDHYVTVVAFTNSEVVVGDPLNGLDRMSCDEFLKKWRFTGIVLKRL